MIAPIAHQSTFETALSSLPLALRLGLRRADCDRELDAPLVAVEDLNDLLFEKNRIARGQRTGASAAI